MREVPREKQTGPLLRGAPGEQRDGCSYLQ